MFSCKTNQISYEELETKQKIICSKYVKFEIVQVEDIQLTR